MASSSSSCDSSDEESNTNSTSRPKYTQQGRRVTSTKSPNFDSFKVRTFENVFKNDGSFLEMFKKMQEQDAQTSKQSDTKNADEDSTESCSNSALDSALNSDSSNDKTAKPVNRIVGKRRPARVLPTGIVKKQRKGGETTQELPDKAELEAKKKERKNDPWSKYMDEVKRYKQQSCAEEEGSRRPLVK